MKVILSCVYNDWTSAAALFQSIGARLPGLGDSWHLVLIDDGSTEVQPPLFLDSVAHFASAEIVVLRRNVGHQRAIAIGLSHLFESGLGDAIVVMDADGEDRPEDLMRLVQAHEQSPAVIVFAERARRSEGFLFRLFYQVYRALHLALTGYRIRFGNFSLIPRPLLRRLVVDTNLWLHYAAAVVAGGVPYTTIPTERGTRLHGRSKLNFTRLVIHGLAAISCYNEIVGVRLILCFGGLGALLFVLLVAVLVVRVATPWAIPGWATSAAGIFCVLLMQALLAVLAFIALAISSRKSQFFFPLQQYKLLIHEIRRLR